jgi:hypothetical protein
MLPAEAIVVLAIYAGSVVWLIRAALAREDAQRTQHRQDLAVLAASHSADIERLHAMYEKGMTASTLIAERMMNMATFGTPTRPEAQVVENMPDAVTRAGRAVDEDTIANAISHLRQNYLAIGITLDDKELEDEARGLLQHGRFIPPAALASMVDARRD